MKYLVALQVGGVMEQPYFTYERQQLIEANSESEACEKYDKINNCSYYYGTIIGNEITGQIKFNEQPKHNSFG